MISRILPTALAAFTFTTAAVLAQDSVKVGVLHSLSGTMAISETSLRDVLLFTFDEINAAGGVMGKKIEPVVVDGASNWPLFAEKAKQLLDQDKVSVTFGCWTSVSRKSVLPVFEEKKGLLFYPVQYEGEEMSPNIFYTAEAVNQQATPAVDYMLEEGKKKFYLIGSDYVYPQTTNLILLEYLLSKGVPLENIGGGFTKDASGKIISAGKYTPFGHTDYQQIISEIKQFAASGDACIINTLNGDTNVPFFKEYAAAGLDAESCPVVSFSVSEDEFRGLPASQLVGQLGIRGFPQHGGADEVLAVFDHQRVGLLIALVARRRHPSVEVIGHTDNTGAAAYNQDLSQRRAVSVSGILRESGVPGGRFSAYGRGEDVPVASNLTPEGRAQNRRVEIIIRPTN